jgi:hypothetical protein
MIDISAIPDALTALKTSKDILQAMVGLHGAAAFNEKRLELQSKIMDAQSSVFLVNEERSALLKTVSDLEKQIADMKTWEGEKQRYVLKAVDSGAFVYPLKAGMENGEPPHWLCANCYENGKKSILQAAGPPATSGPEGMKIAWKCVVCSSVARVGFRTSPQSFAATGGNNAST